MRTVHLLLPCLFMLSLAMLATAEDGSSEQRFLAGLRQRGLFELAESYCLDRLERPDLSESQRAELVIELSRCLAERAVSSPPEMRPPLWQRALQVTEDFALQYPQHPRLPLVRLQGALGLLARGELARQEAEVLAGEEQPFDEARTHLRAAIQELRELADEVDRRMREQNLSGRPEPGPAGLTADQLNSLQKNVRYQLARALRNQAQCYAPDSNDRANSLTQAVQLLEPLAKLDPVDPLFWKSRLDLVVSHRLLGDYEMAQRQLDALGALKPAPPIQLRVRAERIYLALATGRLPQAISLLSQGRRIDAVTSAELDYAWLETYLSASGAAAKEGDRTQAAQWQTKAMDMVEQIEQLHGPYWTRRAGMLLSRHVQESPDGGDLAVLVRTAESLFRSGRLDDAVATYDNARAIAAKQGDPDRAFELGYIAATIQHRRNRHREAMERYRRIAMKMPQHPRASEAHLLAIYHAGQIIKKGQPQDSLEDYAALLKEHLQTWPEGPGAGKVWRWLGRLYEYQQDWNSAVQAYRKISPGNAEYPQAVEAAGRCYEAWFDRRQAAGEPEDTIAADAGEAAGWLESLLAGATKPWSPLQRSAALAAARLRLDYTSAGYDRAGDILSLALQGAPDAPQQWQSAARALLVFSLAGAGKHREAGEVLAGISAGPPEGLFDVVRGLGRLAGDGPSSVRTELAQLQLQTIELLRPRHAQLSRTQQEDLEKIYARALANAGHTDQALAAYRSLAKKYPHDGAVQQRYASLLLTRKDLASLETALKKWRDLENRSPPRSPRWFLAKYQVASLHLELGNEQQAAKMIRLLKLLHPDLGGPQMKAKFEELLGRCRQGYQGPRT